MLSVYFVGFWLVSGLAVSLCEVDQSSDFTMLTICKHVSPSPNFMKAQL